MKTVGQKMHESIYGVTHTVWKNMLPGRKKKWEQAAKTTYEDDPKPVTADRILGAALASSGYYLTQDELDDLAKALNIHDDLPDGVLLPVPDYFNEYLIDYWEVKDGTWMLKIEFREGIKSEQQAINAANAAIRELSR